MVKAKEKDSMSIEERIKQFHNIILGIVGDEFAPKKEQGSSERKRLLGLMRKTVPVMIDVQRIVREDIEKEKAQRSVPDYKALREKIQNILTENEGHIDEDYETCKSHYAKCSHCGRETYHFKYGNSPNCNHAKKLQEPQPCNCSNGRNARRLTTDIMKLVKKAN